MGAQLEANLQQELGNRFEALLSALGNDIEAIKRQHAAKGLLQSGATLKKVRDLCSSLLDRLAEDLVSALASLKESPGLNQLTAGRVVSLFGQVVGPDVPFAHARLSDAVRSSAF
jgi:hypothetical protein